MELQKEEIKKKRKKERKKERRKKDRKNQSKKEVKQCGTPTHNCTVGIRTTGEQNDCGMIEWEGCFVPRAAKRDKECDWEVGLEVTGHWRQMYRQFLCK